MQQVLFHIPGTNIPVYGYGLMMVIGFLGAVQLAKFLAKRVGLDPEIFVNAGLIALLSGVLGARLSHVLENLDKFTDPARSIGANLGDMVNLRSGGLTFYGGLLLAFPITLWYGWRKRVPLRLGMDIVAPCIMIGLAFGRIGCFLNGCCYGAECNLPWAVEFPYYSNAYVDHFHDGKLEPDARLLRETKGGDLALVPPGAAAGNPDLASAMAGEHSLDVHPAQLYSAFNAFLIAAVLVAFFTLRPAPGRVMALMLILKGVTRFLLEMLRTEPTVLGPLSYSMVISIFLVIGGIALWVIFGKLAPREPPAEAVPDRAAVPAHA